MTDDASNGPEDSTPPPSKAHGNADGPSGDWDSDEALDFIKMERSVHTTDEMTDVELTRKLIEQAAPMAAVSMIHLSRHAQNENTRMNASKWVVEFASQIETEDGKAAWEKMLPDVVGEAEKVLADAVKGGDANNLRPGPDGAYEIGD